MKKIMIGPILLFVFALIGGYMVVKAQVIGEGVVYFPIISNHESSGTATPTPTATPSPGLDIDLFFADALAEDATIQACTLADGTETTCYAITIAGYPANYDVGPFCPETTADSADAGGIWFDGNAVYDIDGAFILGLADLYNDSNWKLYDDEGNVNVTDTQAAFEGAARPDVDPAYQNYCIEGRIEWLDNGEPIPTTVLIPTTPVVGASATQANGNLGITLNGVIIAAPAPVDAILSAYTIAAFDDCGGHINPVDGYHLHGARGCSDVGETVDGETPIFAYALDGYAIHSPLAEADVTAAGLDACQGHTTAADGYHYHAASVAENAILSCFTGVTVDDGGPGGGPPPDGAVINLDAFDSAGLVQDPTVVDCTLTNGTETQCAQFVTKYLPDTLGIGPFCPDTIYEAGGIWAWDGENPGVYRLNEAFFTMLKAQGFDFYDADGNVYIGDPAGSLVAGVNNCLEATADATVEMTVKIPLQPIMAAAPTDLGTVAQVGLGIDGVPIFADAPSVLQTGHLPALDECGGHIDPGGWYHWHATATDIDSSFEHEAVDAHCHLDQSATALFGFAFDGYPIYGSVDQDGSMPTDLDACSGHIGVTADYPDGTYHYHAGLDFPNLPTCLVGISANNAFTTTAEAGVGSPGGPGGG